ncbi:hypothetical protein GCM10023194_19590 [Planotetraspora phitsanulokensis]|uniref:Uncharacterized protein n=1 Tax=Planotetraspora phitsanulokensis TaxID=575192 RepID=A0A8J3XFS5_9ACTN|nr:hypothetical protein Pph01_44130 [Planotetraspora phitsanulokensis]
MSAADMMGVLSTGWGVTADPFLAIHKQNDIRFILPQTTPSPVISPKISPGVIMHRFADSPPDLHERNP